MTKKIVTLLSVLALVSVFGVSTLNAKQSSKQPAKPFLIKGKLPHLTGMVKIMWDDEDLALSDEQKEKLLVVRKDTITKAKSLGKVVNQLEAKIVKASGDGRKPESLKEDVYKLASLKAEATMVHLYCIYNTREILSHEQLYILE